MRAHKYRVYLTPEQKATFANWSGAYRWVYNECVEAGRDFPNTLANYRHVFVNDDSWAVEENPWLLETPYEVRDGGLMDFQKALKSNFAKGGKFEIHGKRRKEDQIGRAHV